MNPAASRRHGGRARATEESEQQLRKGLTTGQVASTLVHLCCYKKSAQRKAIAQLASRAPQESKPFCCWVLLAREVGAVRASDHALCGVRIPAGLGGVCFAHTCPLCGWLNSKSGQKDLEQGPRA